MALTKVTSGLTDLDGGITIDNITIDGTEIDLSSGDLTIDVAGDIILDAGGQNWYFEDDGTRVFSISQVSSDVYLGAEVSDKDIFFRVNDGGSTITALTIDGSDAGTATFNHDVKLGDNGILAIGDGGDLQFTHNNSNGTITNSTGNLHLDVAADIILDADGGDIKFQDAGTDIFSIINDSSDVKLKTAVQDKSLKFEGNDGGSVFTALTIDFASSGAASFNAGATFGSKVIVPTAFTMISSAAANNTGDFKIIESANSTAGVGYAAPIIGANIDDAVNGSNVPTQDNVWGGVSGASALSLSADMSADNATHMFWGSGPTESAGTALTKLLSVSRNGGVSFGTDTCNDDNTLNDYEEGTWTATLAFGGNSVGLTYSVRTGYYTKVGRIVTATLYVLLTDKGSSTGNITLSGLPYTALGSNAYAAASLHLNLVSFSGFPQAYVITGSTFAYFGQTADSGTFTQLTNSNISNTTGIIFTVTYQTA